MIQRRSSHATVHAASTANVDGCGLATQTPFSEGSSYCCTSVRSAAAMFACCRTRGRYIARRGRRQAVSHACLPADHLSAVRKKPFLETRNVRRHPAGQARRRGLPALTPSATPRPGDDTPGCSEHPPVEPATHAPRARPARAQHATQPASNACAPATMHPNSGSAEGLYGQQPQQHLQHQHSRH